MKINRVLIGLFAGVFALTGGALSAQTFHEIGPANIGGHVSSIIVDNSDTNQTTVYAGAIAGGLFVKSEDSVVLEQLYLNSGRSAEMAQTLAKNKNIWHEVPYFNNNRQEYLPITSMTQGADNTIYIGTGDNTYQVGSAWGRMSMLGKGIFRYKASDGSFTMIPNTNPGLNTSHNFAAVKHLECMNYGGKFYLFAVTGTGLYRWEIANEGEWATKNPTLLYNGPIDDFLLVTGRRMAYFTVGYQLYKIGDATAANPSCTEISASNSAFNTPNKGIKIAASMNEAHDTCYLYAMVIDSNGRMENIYVTNNEQTWVTLATATVTPLVKDAGFTSGTITVDPTNPKHIFIAGSTIWSGTGYIEGSYYQWTKSSYSENELNGGDYMSMVYYNAMFVHSGIHQIVPAYQMIDGNRVQAYYIATDGGVFYTSGSTYSSPFSYYENINMGMNNVQINHLAVSPDGTVTSGAVSNAVLLMEGRAAHDSINVQPTWYDETADRNLNLNHEANIIFSGTGGHVAASMFQQVKPTSRRLILVSNEEGNYGRAYADYFDYTNTQTWTAGPEFITNKIYYGGNTAYGNTVMGNINLWETYNNTIYKDTLVCKLDTLGYILRKNSSNIYDTVWIGLDSMTTGGVYVRHGNAAAGTHDSIRPVGNGYRGSFQILPGDKAMFTSRAHSDYPFEYTFTKSQLAKEPVYAVNPIQARALIIARDSTDPRRWKVYLTLRATDFTKVWDPGMDYSPTNPNPSLIMIWYPLYESISGTDPASANYRPRDVAMSTDGTKVFIAVQNIETKESMILRFRGFENVNYSVRDNAGRIDKMNDYTRLRQQLTGPYVDGTNSASMLSIDTLRVNNYKWIPRTVSSLRIDTNDGPERLIVTFEDYNSSFSNLGIINNCKTDAWSMTEVNHQYKHYPAYCSMVDRKNKDVYIGTSEGVFYGKNGNMAPYEDLQGIAVTSMQQQQAQMPIRRTLGHNGINPINYLFAKTKWTNAMYFGTYGRGIFMDMKNVTDTVNEIVDSADLSIPTVRSSYEMSNVSIYPNPVSREANIALTTGVAGKATLRIYDLNGRCVVDRYLGTVEEGEQVFMVNTDGMSKGMYLVNVIIGGHTASAKMMVR